MRGTPFRKPKGVCPADVDGVGPATHREPMQDREQAISPEEVVEAATKEVFGKPLVVNVFRSILVEAMVAESLPASWTWCSTDYAAYDFLHESGIRLEVKQSAARQSWTTDESKPRRALFDIAPRTGYWRDGATWISQPGRNADIYIFAYHPISDDTADHRVPEQWEFFVVETAALPNKKSISLPSLRILAPSASISELSRQVEQVRQGMTVRSSEAGEARAQRPV